MASDGKLQTPVFQKRKRLLCVLFMYRDLLAPEYWSQLKLLRISLLAAFKLAVLLPG